MPRSVAILTFAAVITLFASDAGAQPQMPGLSAGTASAPTAPAPGAAPAPSQGATAMEHWASIRDSNDAQLYEGFLRLYPNHPLASLAQTKLDTLRGQGRGSQAVSTQQGRSVAAQPTGAPQSIFTPPPGQSQAASPQTDGPQNVFGGPTGQPPVAGPQLAADLQSALKNHNCYTGAIDGDWGRGSRAALQRFNAMAGTTLAADAPTQEALLVISSWRGGSCKAVAARKTRKTVTRKSTRKRTTTKKRSTTSTKKRAPGGGSIGITIGGGGIGIGF